MDLQLVQTAITIGGAILGVGVSWGILQSFKTQTKEDIKALFSIARSLELENNNIKIKFETIMSAINLQSQKTELQELYNKQNWERIFSEVQKNEQKLESLIKKYNDL